MQKWFNSLTIGQKVTVCTGGFISVIFLVEPGISIVAAFITLVLYLVLGSKK